MSSANAAKLCPNAQNYSALPLPSQVSGYARLMVGEAQVPKLKLAENAALKLKLSMAARPARREPNAALLLQGWQFLSRQAMNSDLWAGLEPEVSSPIR